MTLQSLNVMGTLTSTAWVCIDCSMAHHGAEVDDTDPHPEHEPLNLLDEAACITAGLMEHEHDSRRCDLDHECECETVNFSKRPCDGCGVTDAGSRHALTVWWDEDDSEDED